MNLNCVTLRERSQTQKATYCMYMVARGWGWEIDYRRAAQENFGSDGTILHLFFFFFFNFWLCWVFVFCARAFSSCDKWGPLFIAVRGPLTIAASVVAEHRLQTRRLSSCGSRSQLLRGMWDLPRPGLEPVSPASAGRVSTTAPLGKPPFYILIVVVVILQYAIVKICKQGEICCM